MNLRSMMFVGAAALTTAALATDVLTDKTLGWMRVDSTLPITAVGVPWTDVSDPTANVKVADLVKTDNLTDGDNLYVYNNGTWTFYTLSSGAWVAGTTANSSITATAGNPSEATIARGQALYLERQNPTTPGYFYVYGADGSEITSTTLSGATKYLVASPKAAAFTVTSAKISGASNKDVIQVPLTGGNSRIYQYFTTKNKWRCNGKWEGDAGYEEIPLGTGFWYIASSTDAVTVTW